MKELFSFDFDWLSEEFGNDEDRCTAAEVGLRVGDIYLTELEDLRARTVRQRMRVSANTLALWLAGNWWRLRWEAEPSHADLDWRMSHCLAAAGGGHVWPNLFFCGDGETMHLDLKVTEHFNFPVRYLRDVSRMIPIVDFESSVDQFIESVIARLEASGLCNAALITLWREIQHERHTPALAAYRKLEALLGFDADECSESLMEKLDDLSGKHGRGAIEEMAAACGPDAVANMDALVAHGKPLAQPITIPASAKIRTGMQHNHKKLELQPWQIADAVAKQARSEWSLAPDEPISAQAFAGIVAMDPTLLESQDAIHHTPMSAGFRNGEAHDSIAIILDKKRDTSRRFGLARIIGDHFYSKPEDRFLPATSAKTVRQKFQRAFAQALLCPFDGLMATIGDHTADDDAIQDAAAIFGVSPRLVTTTLVNKGVLDRESLFGLNADYN
ncbi:MAG TPA: hypothetical protein ENI62_06000 [Gammaproteobacteria bacterium]|nr:hypothetical protein [Gammaproteobacteria bacterium]